VQTSTTLVTNQLIGIAMLIIAVAVHAGLNYLALGRQTNGLAAQNAHADAANQLAMKTTALQADANRQATDATLHRWAAPVLAAAIRQIAADSGVTPDEARASWNTYRAQALGIGAAKLVGWFPTLKADDARLLLEHLADTGGTLLASARPTIEQAAAPLMGQIGAEVAALPFNSLHIPPEVVRQAEAMTASLLPVFGDPPPSRHPVATATAIIAPTASQSTAASVPEQLHVVEPSTGEVVGTITPPPPPPPPA